MAAVKKQEPPVETAPEPEVPNAVLVQRVVEDGNLKVEVSALGNVTPDQVLTLLELAIGSYRAKIGL